MGQDELHNFLTSQDRGEKRLSPQEAIAEINGLDRKECEILCQYYDSGLRGQVLREACWSYWAREVRQAFSYLVSEKRLLPLSFEEAFSELNSLNPDRGRIQ